MTEEKTISKDKKSNTLDIDNVMTLDEHNPIGDIGSEAKEQMVDVVDIHIPSIRSILGQKEPNIEVVVETEKEKEVGLELTLDRFSEEGSDSTSITSFCGSLGIEREQIYGLINEKIPLKISRTGNEFDTRISHDSENLDIEPEIKLNSTSWRWQRLLNLWKARQYEKVRVTDIERMNDRSIVLNVEIPWVNESRKLNFSNGGKNRHYPSFSAFFKSVTGRYPMNESDVSSIIGDEISVNYNGRFGLTQDLHQQIEQNKRSFIQYLKDHKTKYMSSILRNSGYFSLLMIAPPFVIIPMLVASLAAQISGSLAIASVFMMILFASTVATTLQSHHSFTQDEPLKGIMED